MLQLLKWVPDCDISILRCINHTGSGFTISIAQALSDTALYIDFGLPVSVIVAALLKKNSALAINGLSIIATLLLAAGFSSLLKHFVHRPRPYITYPDIVLSTDGGLYSFPSGHTVKAMALAFAVAFFFQKRRYTVPVFLWASLVAWSRMCLGAHYPTDVAGAILLSGCVAATVYYFCRRFITTTASGQ